MDVYIVHMSAGKIRKIEEKNIREKFESSRTSLQLDDDDEVVVLLSK